MEKDRFINGQMLAPYGSMPFMGHTVGQIGCGPLAVYNLIESFGEDADLDDILRFCEKYPLLSMWGVFGTNTVSLAMYLKKAGFRPRVVMYPTFSVMERIISRHGAGIINYFHGRGAHYICVRKTSFGYEVYNSANHYSGTRVVRDLRELKRTSKMFLPLSILYPAGPKHL